MGKSHVYWFGNVLMADGAIKLQAYLCIIYIDIYMMYFVRVTFIKFQLKLVSKQEV